MVAGRLDVTYDNKNATWLHKFGKQQFPRFQHGKSFAPNTQKRATIIGELHRINRCTIEDLSVRAERALLRVELLSIEIPPHVINGAFEVVQVGDIRGSLDPR